MITADNYFKVKLGAGIALAKSVGFIRTKLGDKNWVIRLDGAWYQEAFALEHNQWEGNKPYAGARRENHLLAHL